MSLEISSRDRSVAPTPSNELTLLGCGTHTTTTATEGSTAAFRLALIVLEDEQGIIPRFKFRTH
jgi:hypothetical protein